jgi:anaerobic ribonucleoside-triphosphate reductase activating protein
MDLALAHKFLCKTPVLGPPQRAVIWVQGCSIGCEGCILPEAWNPADGKQVPVTDVAKWVLSLEAIEGLTLTGGEPMEQAIALCRLIDLVRRQRNLGVLTYTGHTLEYLRAKSDLGQSELIARTDLLIDGPYVRSLHGSLLWRGSTNQRLLNLTSRYSGFTCGPHVDSPAGLEVYIDNGGDFRFVGVPPLPDFRAGFRKQMLERGVRFREGEEEK